MTHNHKEINHITHRLQHTYPVHISYLNKCYMFLLILDISSNEYIMFAF